MREELQSSFEGGGFGEWQVFLVEVFEVGFYEGFFHQV
jgi:hypothetical protein